MVVEKGERSQVYRFLVFYQQILDNHKIVLFVLIAISTIFSWQLLLLPFLEHELDKRHKAVSTNMVNFS